MPVSGNPPRRPPSNRAVARARNTGSAYDTPTGLPPAGSGGAFRASNQASALVDPVTHNVNVEAMSPEQRKEYERQFAEQIKKLFGYEWGNNIDPTTGRQRGGGSMTPTGGGSGGVSGGWLY